MWRQHFTIFWQKFIKICLKNKNVKIRKSSSDKSVWNSLIQILAMIQKYLVAFFDILTYIFIHWSWIQRIMKYNSFWLRENQNKTNRSSGSLSSLHVDFYSGKLQVWKFMNYIKTLFKYLKSVHLKNRSQGWF